MSRVRSAARLVAWGSIPVGSLAGGFLAAAFGAQTALLILTGIMCTAAAAATLARGMRQLPTPSRADAIRAIPAELACVPGHWGPGKGASLASASA